MSKFKNLLTPYKSFVYDGCMLSVPLFWYLDYRHMDFSEMIILADIWNKLVVVEG